jgi:hypothetical protein
LLGLTEKNGFDARRQLSQIARDRQGGGSLQLSY